MLTVDQATLDLLNTPHEAMFLGIIDADERVHLVEASARGIRGHSDWVRSDPEMHPRFGFSVTACNGRVRDLYRASILNDPRNDALLPALMVQRLCEILPVCDDLTVFGE